MVIGRLLEGSISEQCGKTKRQSQKKKLTLFMICEQLLKKTNHPLERETMPSIHWPERSQKVGNVHEEVMVGLPSHVEIKLVQLLQVCNDMPFASVNLFTGKLTF